MARARASLRQLDVFAVAAIIKDPCAGRGFVEDMLSNIQITLKGERATALAYVYAFHRILPEQHGALGTMGRQIDQEGRCLVLCPPRRRRRGTHRRSGQRPSALSRAARLDRDCRDSRDSRQSAANDGYLGNLVRN
jgi:hypothetical protein